MPELVLERREPAAIVRYCLEKLEAAALKRGEFPTLIHTATEAMVSVDARTEKWEKAAKVLQEKLAARIFQSEGLKSALSLRDRHIHVLEVKEAGASCPRCSPDERRLCDDCRTEIKVLRDETPEEGAARA